MIKHDGHLRTQGKCRKYEPQGSVFFISLFSRFFKNINRLINKDSPLKDVSKRRLKLLTKPWLTKGIRRSIRVKNNLFFNSNWNKYKQYRNKLTTLIRLSKQKYYQNFFNSNIKNMRQTWKGINELLGG